jgi:hypothetical protein
LCLGHYLLLLSPDRHGGLRARCFLLLALLEPVSASLHPGYGPG